MSKHTPGPWRAETDGARSNDMYWGVISEHNDLWVAATYRSGTTAARDRSDEAYAEAEANARLIARAPEMASELDRLQAERADDEATRAMMDDILSRTAVALRGPQPEGTRYGWADLPERVEATVAAIDVMQKAAALNGAEADRLQRRVAELEREAQAKQARIDALMLEFCPDEMTPEQMADWARHQTARQLTPEERAAIDAALSEKP